MPEIGKQYNPIYLVVLSHGQKRIGGVDFLTNNSQQRVLGAVTRYEQLFLQGYDPIVIFTGGKKPNALFDTSELMSNQFQEISGFPSTALPLSNETDGNIKTCFENIPNGLRVEVISQRYHNFLNRVVEIIDRYKEDREVNFVAIEDLDDNYIDTDFIPESLRFSSTIEALQCTLLPIAGWIGIDLPAIYKTFSKFRLFLNQTTKTEPEAASSK